MVAAHHRCHAEAEKEGQGVLLLDGKLIENLHVNNANRVVAMAETIAGAESAEVLGK